MSLALPGTGPVLGIWAHPDDEVYLSGGLMAAARAAGRRVVCVTATRGEHGTGDPERWPPERLAATRDAELTASLAALGVTEHHQLGLPDGGCAAQPFDTVVARLAAIVAEVRPGVVVTFGPDGFTGHPDHRMVSAWAEAARSRAAPAARLLYPRLTAEFADTWRDLYDRLALFPTADLPWRAAPDRIAVRLRLDDASADRKLVALRAQASQTAELVALLGVETMRAWACTEETFVDALPARALDFARGC
ncbi:PIG-L deacetylase family protein [Nocardia harenae]|uniref:PIG-L deacetylase family protein n=1 Tax=Nocardia harenae TaxID=358707 RepID=UPI00082ABFE3|nr:PIG-L family deacetylase [Nocardia harenae]